MNGPPREEGFYLYKKCDGSCDKVEVYRFKDVLLADSDNWFTFLPVELVTKYICGRWNRRIE